MPDALDGDYSHSQAVLMGTWTYRYLKPVPAAEHSLDRMVRLMRGPLCGNWPESRTRVVANPRTVGDLAHELATLFQPVRDVALFYYVGHGQYDPDDRLCLSVGQSRDEPAFRRTTSLTFEDVRQAFRASRAATKIAILDCCFAGLAAGEEGRLSAGARRLPPPGFYLLMASGEYSTAWFQSEKEHAKPETYFTKYLIDIIEAGRPGGGGDFTLGLLYDLLSDALVRDGKPEPTRRVSDHATDFVFARNHVAGTAVPHGDPAALYATAFALEAERRVADLPRIKALYRAAADAGHADAMGRLGLICEGRTRTWMEGRMPHHNTGGDLDTAKHWYRKAAEHGSAFGALWLGELCEDRLGELAEALRWYDVALARGCQLARERRDGLRQRLAGGLGDLARNTWSPVERVHPRDGSQPTGGDVMPIDPNKELDRLTRAAGTYQRWMQSEWGGEEPLAIAYCLDALIDACGGHFGEWGTLTEAEQNVTLRYFMTYQPTKDDLPVVAKDFYRRVPPGNLKRLAGTLLRLYGRAG